MDELNVVDEASLDPEVYLQTEFVSWLHKHPGASLNAEPLFDVFDRTLDFYGFRWYLRVAKVADEAGSWREKPRAFAVYKVEPTASGWISYSKDYGKEEIQPTCAVSGRNLLEFPLFSEDDRLDSLVQRTADFNLRSEIMCKGFIYMETIESADSFEEVLDTLYEFSSWLSITDAQSEQEAEYDLRSVMEFMPSKGIRYLKGQAEDASRMCQTAMEAQQVVSKAAARMLEECFSQLPIDWECDPAGSENQVGLRWAKRFKRSKAIGEGFMLQWCRVDWKLSSCIDCELDVGELIMEEPEEVAASCFGVLTNKPLLIRIEALSESIEIRQELGDGSFSAKSIATHFLLPNVVKKHISFPDLLFAQTNNNVLVAMLHEVASYLSHLSSICFVCSQPLHRNWACHPTTCSSQICEATFDCWAKASSSF